MITLNGNAVRVIGAVLRDKLMTVAWPEGRVRGVSMWALHGTTGGELEVVRVCREVEKRQEVEERAEVARRKREALTARRQAKQAGGELDRHYFG